MKQLGDPTAVYRFFDEADRLLYVGMTGNIRLRWAGHAADKPWWPDVARQTTTWFDTRAEAAAAEAEAIKSEGPAYNIQGTPLHRERVEAGLERRRARRNSEGREDVPCIHAKRAGKYWELHIDGVGVTQARNLHADADEMIRSRISMEADAPTAPTGYRIVAQITDEIDAMVTEAQESSREAELAVALSAQMNRASARNLQSAGLSGQDIAAVLGISPQRVSQLLNS